MKWAAFFAILAVIAAIVSHFTFWASAAFGNVNQTYSTEYGPWRACVESQEETGCGWIELGSMESTFDVSRFVFLAGTLVFLIVALLAYFSRVSNVWLIILSWVALLHLQAPLILWPAKFAPDVAAQQGEVSAGISLQMGYFFAVGAAGLGLISAILFTTQ